MPQIGDTLSHLLPTGVCRGGIFDPLSEEEETKGQSEFPKCQMLSKHCLMFVQTMTAAVFGSGSSCYTWGGFCRAHSARLDHGQERKSRRVCTKSPPKSRESYGFQRVDFNLLKTSLDIKAHFSFNESPHHPPPVWMAMSTPSRELTTVLFGTIIATAFDLR